MKEDPQGHRESNRSGAGGRGAENRKSQMNRRKRKTNLEKERWDEMIQMHSKRIATKMQRSRQMHREKDKGGTQARDIRGGTNTPREVRSWGQSSSLPNPVGSCAPSPTLSQKILIWQTARCTRCSAPEPQS
jgi:hypothetical protein